MKQKRFTRAGVYMMDQERSRSARFMSDREAQESVDFLNDGATYAQIEAYVWVSHDEHR